MAEKVTATKTTNLAPVYVVAISATVLAVVCGAITLGMAIAFLAGKPVSFPGLLGLLLSSSNALVTPIAIGLMGVLTGLVSFMAFGKIKKSADASDLISSRAYKMTNTVAEVVTCILGIVSLIYAFSVALATLLAVQDGLPWGSYYLGQFVPMLLLGGGLFGMTFVIKGFSKAKVSAKILALVPWIIAMTGFVLVAVAVGVKSHSNNALSIFGISSSISTGSGSSYYNYSLDTLNNTLNGTSNTKESDSKKKEKTSSSTNCSEYGSTTSDYYKAYQDGDLNYTQYFNCVKETI